MIHKLLTIHCLSPLHCGSGQGIAGIDLPVQRERHTGWPLIPGSSIKGVLRDAYRGSLNLKAEDADKDPRTHALFGSDNGNTDLGLGALIFGDAILLAFPVRSLVGVFAWVTCPMALGRIARLPDEKKLTENLRNAEKILKIASGEILCDKGLIAHDSKVVLEDHTLKASDNELPKALLEALKPLWLTSAHSMLEKHLAIVSDDLFSWFARHATQVETRIALDPGTKTVKDGAMFSEETVPPESVFIVPISAEDARHPSADKTLKPADMAIGAFAELLMKNKHQFQFGGKATIGRGQCAVQLQ